MSVDIVLESILVLFFNISVASFIIWALIRWDEKRQERRGRR